MVFSSKKIFCPIASRLARAISKAESNKVFNCSNCNAKVKNLRYLSDEAALQAVKEDKDVCFFSGGNANNVTHVTEPRAVHWLEHRELAARGEALDDKPCRVIRTARSVEEANFAIKNGYNVSLQRVESPSGAVQQLAVLRDPISDQLVEVTDIRFWPEVVHEGQRHRMESVQELFVYASPETHGPMAGYVLPDDLAIGEEVFVEDAIEHLIMDMQQYTKQRVHGWWAVWDGEKLNFKPLPSFDFVG